jgi:GDPmannose 4,6-dehydratase
MREVDSINLGDVNTFRDWSHVRDIVRGYVLLAERGRAGDVYNLGSGRTNSVISYLLIALEEVGWKVKGLRTQRGTKTVDNPAESRRLHLWGIEFDSTRIDEMMLTEGLTFDLRDEGLTISTNKMDVQVRFDPDRFRPSDVPILVCDASRSQELGYQSSSYLRDIVRDQINYYYVPRNRHGYYSVL